MAAVILEFVSRQVEERSDIASAKNQTLHALFEDLSTLLGDTAPTERRDETAEARLCQVNEKLYEERSRLGEELFTAANQRVRQALRELLNQDLRVAGKQEE